MAALNCLLSVFGLLYNVYHYIIATTHIFTFQIDFDGAAIIDIIDDLDLEGMFESVSKLTSITDIWGSAGFQVYLKNISVV